jgi:hypothetical protein
MNETREDLQHDDSRWFDLLVDGELDESNRRELLSRLDAQPGGWRRCALAFLEAQSWRRELGDWVEDAQAQAPAVPVSTVQLRSASLGIGSWLAIAASFVAAFGLGLYLRDLGRPRGFETTPQVAVDNSERPPALDAYTLARQEHGPQTLPGGGVMTMSFRPTPDGQLREVEVPFIDAGEVAPEWLAAPTPPMPLDVLRDLHRSGHRIEQSRQLVPVDLHDGRQVVVPVDQVNIHYVGNRSYQ